MMLLFVLIALIWLIVLQVTVNRLQEQIDRLKGTSPKAAVVSSDDVPKVQPSPTTTSAALAEPFEMHEEKQAPKPQTVQPAKVYQPQPKEPATPSVEITAAKLFSWIGGFMLFLGVVFGIKYAVENSILSPSVRIILSILTGGILALVGYFMKTAKYRVTAHTLLGSGVAIVYAAVFCAHALYHFINLPTAFILMALTSFAALGASLKKDAKYVGYLGAVIAFLTPILLNNGSDAWVAFFLYVFCINAAAAYAAVKKGWNGLLICTLFFTWLSQAAWLFPLQGYKLLGVVTFFSLYALASAWLAYRHKAPSVISYAVGGFLVMGLVLMLPVASWLHSPVVSTLPNTMMVSLQLIGYVLLVNGLILVLAGKEYIAYFFARMAKVLSFLILCAWMLKQGSGLPLWMTLGACLLFTALNSGVELALRCNKGKPDAFSVLYPIATMGGLLILSLLPGQAATLDFISVFGLFSLLLLGVLLLAVLAGMLWTIFLAVGLLFVFLFISLLLGIGGQGECFFILMSGLLPLFLCAGGFFVLRKSGKLTQIAAEEKGVAAVTALTPFVLILTVLAQTTASISSLHWVLGTAWAVCALTALAARLYKTTFTLPAAAVGAGIVQLAVWGKFVWGNTALIQSMTIWVLALLVLFILIPFLSKEHFWNKVGPWVACSLAGLCACLMGCLLLDGYYPEGNLLGIIPAVLLGIYALLLHKLWGNTATPQAHPVSIGFMSGAALIFLTVISPLQIHSHWLCVAWAVQAISLAFLYKWLPYRAWQICTATLLCIVSAWLLLSGDFYPVPAIRIWNWYLWIYGLVACALFITARLWDKPASWKCAFYALGGCMLFWLLNIEIAHWFNAPHYLTFDFTGQLAQALTYTLAWGLFAFCMIGLGLYLQKNAVSKVGVGVMGLTLGKFFLSDIWQLQSLYRILGLFGLAVLLIVASFWYQRKQKVQ